MNSSISQFFLRQISLRLSLTIIIFCAFVAGLLIIKKTQDLIKQISSPMATQNQ